MSQGPGVSGGSGIYDVVVVGAGVMGATAALFLARGGMKVLLIDRGELCREGLDAGDLLREAARRREPCLPHLRGLLRLQEDRAP